MRSRLLRVFLDDVRSPPDDSWTIVRDPSTAIRMLGMGLVEEISFDHDLGEGRMTGYDVACVLERLVYEGKIDVPKWIVHSANPVGAHAISMAMISAERFSRFSKEGS